MIVRFQFQLNDFDRATRKGRFPLPSIPPFARIGLVLAILSLVAFVGAACYLAFTDSFVWGLALAAPLFVAAIIIRVLTKEQPALISEEEWRAHPFNGATIEAELTSREFCYRTPRWRQHLEPRAVKNIYENAAAFWVSIETESYLIPKRAFISEQEQAKFADELQTFLGRPILRSRN